jgi:hypothetical protein
VSLAASGVTVPITVADGTICGSRCSGMPAASSTSVSHVPERKLYIPVRAASEGSVKPKVPVKRPAK